MGPLTKKGSSNMLSTYSSTRSSYHVGVQNLVEYQLEVSLEGHEVRLGRGRISVAVGSKGVKEGGGGCGWKLEGVR